MFLTPRREQREREVQFNKNGAPGEEIKSKATASLPSAAFLSSHLFSVHLSSIILLSLHVNANLSSLLLKSNYNIVTADAQPGSSLARSLARNNKPTKKVVVVAKCKLPISVASSQLQPRPN